ncbi:MAG: hypothetical protein ACRC1K_24495, partial [Planctomycetia bacterium]
RRVLCGPGIESTVEGSVEPFVEAAGLVRPVPGRTASPGATPRRPTIKRRAAAAPATDAFFQG